MQRFANFHEKKHVEFMQRLDKLDQSTEKMRKQVSEMLHIEKAEADRRRDTEQKYSRMITTMPESERRYYPLNADLTGNPNYASWSYYDDSDSDAVVDSDDDTSNEADNDVEPCKPNSQDQQGARDDLFGHDAAESSICQAEH